MLKSQEEELSNLLIEYSAGNYSAKGKLSEKGDEVDMIISGINMLGEELLATNVSMEYFLSIYNAVTDLVFILNNQGKIMDVNNSVCNTYKIEKDELLKQNIDVFINDNNKTFDKVKGALELNNESFTFESEVEYNEIKIIGLITCSHIINRFNEHQGYLVSIKNITESKKTEQLIMQTIISTEQHEQRRMADDLHDSLGQELSMTKLMLTNLEAYHNNDKNYINLVDTAKDILDEAIAHLREVCFNLMPSVLIKGGIDLAIKEFVKKLNSQNIMKFSYDSEGDFENLNIEIEIMIFRIIQEFVNNSIKHSEAKNVEIVAKICENHKFYLSLKDNGKGFNPKKLKPYTDGRGINNLESKVKAFHGSYELNSEENIGTTLKIYFPKIKDS